MNMKVKIYKPAKTAMQSGRGKNQTWVLEYETTSARVADNLIGWSSSKDTLNQVKLKFKTLDMAIKHARKNGWEYSISPSQERKVRPRNYGDNFKYFPPEKKSAK